jgi:aminomethyltransferase
MAVHFPDGSPAGETTSGTFSPTLKAGVALALVAPTLTFGDEVAIDIRGRSVPARVVRLPFVESSPK